jgi:hypothetical protein
MTRGASFELLSPDSAAFEDHQGRQLQEGCEVKAGEELSDWYARLGRESPAEWADLPDRRYAGQRDTPAQKWMPGPVFEAASGRTLPAGVLQKPRCSSYRRSEVEPGSDQEA